MGHRYPKLYRAKDEIDNRACLPFEYADTAASHQVRFLVRQLVCPPFNS